MIKFLKRLLNIKSDPQLHVYRGYGSQEKIVVSGRVTEEFENSNHDSHEHGNLKTFYELIRNYIASPLPDIKVNVNFEGIVEEVITDETGTFEAHIDLQDSLQNKEAGWHEVTVRLANTPEIQTNALVLVEGTDNTFGVISDIDDTILISNATRKIKLLYSTFFQSLQKRLPFEGVSELYQSLVKGPSNENNNPVFYVSSSHLNLHDFLTKFFELHNLPQGPLFLKKTTGLKSAIKSAGNHTHKEEAIQLILDTYPDLPFTLLGDTGQKDAEIYESIALKNPNRVKAIFLRDVTKYDDPDTTRAIETLRDKVPVISVKTSDEMLEKAQELELIKL